MKYIVTEITSFDKSTGEYVNQVISTHIDIRHAAMRLSSESQLRYGDTGVVPCLSIVIQDGENVRCTTKEEDQIVMDTTGLECGYHELVI